jgi:hypothetical protein
LKRFQREQNLPDDGKIGSLSLIALGLGPKRASLSPVPNSVPTGMPVTSPTAAQPSEAAPAAAAGEAPSAPPGDTSAEPSKTGP